jgi:hypothetical protein
MTAIDWEDRGRYLEHQRQHIDAPELHRLREENERLRRELAVANRAIELLQGDETAKPRG